MNRRWMLEALALSYCFKGTTSPNPTVGAVLLGRDGQYLGSAVTQKAGEDHAERRLLKNYSLAETEGGTLFVTLEPCGFFGKTPPCTEIIIERKIAHVFIATLDPNPQVCGKGMEALRQAGIQVEVGLCEKEAKAINRDFFYALKHQRPFIFAKVGLSLDGFMATSEGVSQWITGPRSRRMGHILRYRSDAILIGARTAMFDNPSLTARPSSQTHKVLLRVVLDGEASLPEDLTLLSDELPTLWVVKESFRTDPKIQKIQSRPFKEVFFLREESPGLEELLSFLYMEKHILSLMLEGGSQVFRAFWEQGYLEEIFLFYGALFLGNGLSPFPIVVDNIQKAPSFELLKSKILNGDLMIYGNINGQ